MVFQVKNNTDLVTLKCCGRGLEPRVHFERTTIEFNPSVPNFASEEAIVVCNPCDFEVELYSVDFDKVYLEEERVSVLEYEEFKTSSVM